MSKAGRKIIEGLEEALRYARGEDTGARVTIVEVPDVPAIRKKLGFTQQQFAQRFGVSLGTLRNWEQGLRLPEGPARVLLTVIDREPEAVKRALARSPVKRVIPPGAKRVRSKTPRQRRKRP
jgi:putative transcriptional regulator